MLRRLEAEPAVSGVTFASHFPGSEPYERIEVEGSGNHWVFINRVDIDLFTVFGIPTLAGRGSVDSDRREGSNGVLVNSAFAERLFGGDNVLGRRIRRVPGANPEGDGESPWLEIVGVVPDFAKQLELEQDLMRVYEPVALADIGQTVSLGYHGTIPVIGSGPGPNRGQPSEQQRTETGNPNTRGSVLVSQAENKERAMEQVQTPNRRLQFRVFRGTWASWDELFHQAAELANELGPERVVSISHSEDKNDGVVVVWYWQDENSKA